MATWPTGTDVRSWLGFDQVRSDAASDELLDEVAAAATAVILGLLDVARLPQPVAPAVVGDCPTSIRLAIRILASKLWVRRDAPGGIVSFQEFAIRVNQFDPDVDRLIASWQSAPVW
ncbi:MAG TPA: hypothetical protein VNJ54_04375 [Plantibacter sp.]|uniref:hypothetical protein n=1 Tax=Plantibacter sp. TaxID=1871045 RepID=UPI002BB4FB8C|nr:hypothetical protein [Plantibacter sp.]